MENHPGIFLESSERVHVELFLKAHTLHRFKVSILTLSRGEIIRQLPCRFKLRLGPCLNLMLEPLKNGEDARSRVLFKKDACRVTVPEGGFNLAG